METLTHNCHTGHRGGKQGLLNGYAQLKSNVDLSIIIVSYNVRDYLLACLASIYEHPPDFDFEVIVVDNVSSDGSVEASREAFPAVELIASDENLGLARGSNLGLAHSSGRYVLLLNPDTEVLEGTLDGMVQFADSCADASVFTCRLLNSDSTLQYSCFRFPNLWMALFGFFPVVPMDSVINGRYPRECFDSIFEPEHILGACIVARCEAIEAVGGLDENYFMYFEETDLCYRFVKAGHRSLYTPQYSIIHHGRRSTSRYPEEMSVAFYDSQAYFFRKNYGLTKYLALKLIVMAGLLFWTMRSSLSFARQRIDFDLFRTRLNGYLKILLATGAPRGY